METHSREEPFKPRHIGSTDGRATKCRSLAAQDSLHPLAPDTIRGGVDCASAQIIARNRNSLKRRTANSLTCPYLTSVVSVCSFTAEYRREELAFLYLAYNTIFRQRQPTRSLLPGIPGPYVATWAFYSLSRSIRRLFKYANFLNNFSGRGIHPA